MEVIQDFLHVGHKFRPGIPITPTSVTIHNTGNPNSYARHERAWLDNPVNLNSGNYASWHYVLDEAVIIQAIPETEMAYHAGPANASSIGIEICETGDQALVWRRSVRFVAGILRRYNWGIANIKTHNYWTGKNCPRLLLPRWDEFLRDVQMELGVNPMTRIRVELTGEVREFDGVLVEGRTYAPIRALLESLGYVVEWDEASSVVMLSKPRLVVTEAPERWSK